MKNILLSSLLLFVKFLSAQNTDCVERALAKEGGWLKLKDTRRASTADYAIQNRFMESFRNSIKRYKPVGLQAQYSSSFLPAMHGEPVATYTETVFAMFYGCGNGEPALAHETNTNLTVAFNRINFVSIYDTLTDDTGTGYFDLREGLPVELKPGIWKFNDKRAPLGFGNEGISRTWVLTYPGQVPWKYVSRKEFLLKRKVILQKQYAEAKKQTQEAIDYWDTFKKEKEKEYANDAVKLANFMSGYYNPGIAGAKARRPQILDGFETALQKVDAQLEAPSEELNKIAIVIKSGSNAQDYQFSESMVQFAELLIRPNPSYFKKTASPSIPQMITVTVTFDPKNPPSAAFAVGIEQHLDLQLLQSFIGKNTPPQTAVSVVNEDREKETTSSPGLKKPAVNKTKPEVTNAQSSTTPSILKAGKGGSVNGFFSAPAGVSISVSNAEGSEQRLTAAKASKLHFQSTPVALNLPVKDKDNYDFAVKAVPQNIRALVYPVNRDRNQALVRIEADYIYDLLTRSSDDRMMSTFYESFAPAIGGYNSEEGRYVVFISNSKGLAGSDGKYRQVFWRDRNEGITRMISVTAGGEPANGDCGEPSISADGKTVVFESRASNLAAGDNNNLKDIFMWQASSNTIALISKSTNGSAADGESFDAMVSGNGQTIVFTSSAANLSVTPRGKSVANIFLHTLNDQKTEMISIDPVLKSGGNGYKGSISFDGNRISFCSSSNTLVPNDNNGLWDIFLWERGMQAFKRISMTANGSERNGGTESASRQVASTISGNGRFVAFATTASNMLPADNNKFQDVFIADTETGEITIASATESGNASDGDSPIEQGERVALSYDGIWVAFPTKATNLGAPGSNIILHNRVTNKKFAVTGVKGSYVGRPGISYNGSYVIFGKSATLDPRFSQSGIFASFTGNGPCRDSK